MDALNEALADKLAKSNTKYLKSQDAITAEINAYMAAPSNAFPPAMPVKPNNEALVKIHAESKNYLKFNFGGPLWQVEKLTLQERVNIFTKGA